MLRNLLLLLFLLSSPVTQAGDRPTLNSELIEARFGSYYVAVLFADDDLRVSNLYSVDNHAPTMRTLAIVEFDDSGNPAIAVEQQLIVDGGSIGATFKESGWSIEKNLLAACSTSFANVDYPLLKSMKITPPATLIYVRYQFRLQRDASEIDYATITEIYHPQFINSLDGLAAFSKSDRQMAENECDAGHLPDLSTLH
jgi:hypothetical protein